uniref:Phycobiliprotein ApcE n=1 Tax=Calliarthron tuberculosum TaxID=48942 RepID=M4IU72_CALTB|nr:phycobilisome core-membrane linker polypeptide [Calliarthron tuberculosum]AGA63868.1 phycobilisome core-membrane linker polypeptide [Calliarthron tuberculosum]
MSVKASGGSPTAKPQLYRTASISTIAQAEQQDRFLQLGELNELVAFLNSGTKRLEVANILAKNANVLVSKAADKIFVGGSAISYLERPQASFLSNDNIGSMVDKNLSGDRQGNLLNGLQSAFNSGEGAPPGFKPINIVRYGSSRMKKSLRDLDWFLRYLTYAIIAGDPNILTVNIRGLRDLIENACSSAAAIVALREMRKIALTIVNQDIEAENLIRQYFNVIISEFEASSFTDKLRKRNSTDLQGLCLPQIYAKAGISVQKFTMKSSLSIAEKNIVISACYRQVFERDIIKAYNLSISDLDSQVKNGRISVKEFVRALGKSYLYKKDFFEPFVNSRVLELSFRHFLGRGPSSLKEFQKYFSVLSARGLDGLIDSLINSTEYADYFGEETVPYSRSLGEEAQECRNWGPQIDLLNYSAPFRKIPQFVTLFSDYNNSLPDQHPYGLSNDPLSIQFGAIFPQNRILLRKKSAPFGKDTRRILIRRGPGIYSQISSPNHRSKVNNTFGLKIFQLDNDNGSLISSNIQSSLDSVIRASYLRVFGRLVYEEELITLKKIESQLKDRKISVREFIRQLSKSSIFRSLYWQPFYICKAIEYIHNRLLGRPTYGRQEINKYFDISYKQGYNALIDAIIDSPEYLESFGNNTVPYERYITPLGLAARILKPGFNRIISESKSINELNNQFMNLGKSIEVRSTYNVKQRIGQGVTSQRDQNVIFQYYENTSKLRLEQILRASYRQVFERDISSFSMNSDFISLDEAFLSREITVRQLIERLGSSYLYSKEFYQPYTNTRVIELGTKHFLGRAPNNQAEIRFYNQILASQGLLSFITILINSKEYDSLFGSDIVPYRRFPTLPAANFPNTDKLYNRLTKQNNQIVIPSFIN